MTPDDRAIAAALERFGREVIVPGRDAGMWWHDAAVAQAPRAIPQTATLDVRANTDRYNQLARLPPEVRELVRHMIIQAVDGSIHALLMRLSDLGDEGAKLIVDGVDILEHARHELHGYPLTERGWFARFSKYGERGGPPVP